jgi:hypothetical protein
MFIFAFVFSFVGVAIFFLMNQSQKSEPGIALGSGPMFDTIAPYYDSANQMMSLGYDQSWRQTLVEDLDLKVDDIVLDISTGTGIILTQTDHHYQSSFFTLITLTCFLFH